MATTWADAAVSWTDVASSWADVAESWADVAESGADVAESWADVAVEEAGAACEVYAGVEDGAKDVYTVRMRSSAGGRAGGSGAEGRRDLNKRQ